MGIGAHVERTRERFAGSAARSEPAPCAGYAGCAMMVTVVNAHLRLALVRGLGDIGSAVAHRLFTAGHPVLMHDLERPTHARRGMAFTDAIFDGRAELAGVEAVREDDPSRLRRLLEQHAVIPVTTMDFAALLDAMQPDVVVDARMRKRAQPEAQRGSAKLTIGLGPNFKAGDAVDVVVETSWERLGAVITEGGSLPLAGEPRALGGHARDRYVYAPCSGVFCTKAQVGDVVREGEQVANIDGTALLAPLGGVLRGLTHDGVLVSVGTKVIEVDPRGDSAAVFGLWERPSRIADGVVHAIAGWRIDSSPK